MGCSTCKYHTLDRIGEDYMLDDYCTYYNEWGKRDVDHWVRKENGVRECEGYESSSGCFLTSACCAYLGKPDDCVELETLRRFRDQKLKGTPEGDALVKDYYESAPKIVEGIEESGKKEEYYAYIYDVILECIRKIEEGKDEEAVKAYLDMYRRLSDKFLPQEGA